MPRPRDQGKYGKPTYSQAAKVVRRFGGEAKLAKLIGVSRITVYRWSYRRPYGSDGLIPTEHIEKIRAVARIEGVLIRPEDWTPEVIKYEVPASPTALSIPQPPRARPALADILL
jgi:hypothetical protein